MSLWFLPYLVSINSIRRAILLKIYLHCIGGSVTLNSTNPFDFPQIDPAFLTSPFDQQVLLESVRAARRFALQPPWDGYVLDRYGLVGDADTDEEILAAARTQIVTIWHPTSTARMSPANASWGVVDSRLRVKGAEGLRVVDASVFVSIIAFSQKTNVDGWIRQPIIPASHTVAPTYIVAERAAAFILEEWSGRR